MAATILIIGESGTGKSTSIRTLNPEETYIINVLDKPLPFKGFKHNYKEKDEKNGIKGNYYSSDNSANIIKCAKFVSSNRPDIKNLIIDDYQYVMANEFMRRALEKGYGKFAEIGKNGWEIILELGHLRNDLDCFILSHSDVGDDGVSRCKTIGRMLNDKVVLEGMVTIVLHTVIIDGEHKFITNHDGSKTAKSPMGLFEDKLIDNDLNFVKQKMAAYFDSDIPQ